MSSQFRLRTISAVLGFAISIAQGQTRPDTASTPGEFKATAAREAIAKYPKNASGYNDLAIAFIAQARETANPTFYDQAESSLKTALRVAPDNFETRKVEVQVLLGKHEFEAARIEALKLNKIVPDDVPTYGFIADADIALGDYADAEKQVQWMLTLRQDTAPAMDRVAQLRELFGDLDGAMDALRVAMGKTPPSETEQVAGMLTRYAHLQLLSGQLNGAESACNEALQTFPGYPAALCALAEMRIIQKRYADAVGLLTECQQSSPLPALKCELAEALERAGKDSQAKSEFADFVREARVRIAQDDNANVDLVRYDIQYGHNPGEALAVAKQEISRRHDVWTLDAYACALAANTDAAAAKKQVQQALNVGVKEPGILYDAGNVASLLDDQAAARGYFEKVVAGGLTSVYYESAEKALAQLALSASKTGQ